MRRKNVFHNMSYDQYGCNTKEKFIIKEMINKYLVKLEIKDFLLTKISFYLRLEQKMRVILHADSKIL